MNDVKNNLDEPKKDIEYVTFSSKFHDISKMFCITAIQEEIEVFRDREDFGYYTDPDHSE